MMRVQGLSHYIDERCILNDISLVFPKGTTSGIVGRSGAGKSTLLALLSCHLPIQRGTVIFQRKPLPNAADLLIPGHPDIRLVDQQYALDPFHTVAENLYVEAMHHPKALAQAMVEELLELLELQHVRDLKGQVLSGGEQQRLALGRALCKAPEVLFLDEPFAHLDVHIRQRLVQFLQAYQKRWKTTLVLVSHNGGELLQLCDHIHYLKDGSVQRSDTPEAFYSHPTDEEEARYFGEINVLRLNRVKHLFRPFDYSLEATAQHPMRIEVKVLSSRFAGPYVENVLKVGKQSLLLYSLHPLNPELNEIFIA